MKKSRYRFPSVSLFTIILLTIFILVPTLAFCQTPKKGEVIFVSGYPVFFQKGGDPATHLAGNAPLISTTVFEGLVDCGVNLEYLPAVAKSWTIAPDLMSIDFYIKEGIKFHNGDPLTAEDVKFSMETHMRKRLRQVLGYAYRKRIKEVEVVDTYHARFHLRTPGPDLWKRLWWNGAMMPKKYRESVGDKGFADKPIGSGPFKWVDYKQDRFFTMEAVKNHHRKSPEIDRIKILFVPEHSTRLAMLKAGEADIIGLARMHIPVVKADPNLHLKQVKYTQGMSIELFDLAYPDEPSPFLDIRVREAVSLAIDRKTICEKLLFGASVPHGEVLSPYNLGFDPNVKPDPYDPERARALLKEAGYANGFETTFSFAASAKYLVQAIQANLLEVGIKVKIDYYEGGAWFIAHELNRFAE